MKKQTIVVIPARFASTRLPGKPLIEFFGKPMIQWVYERAVKIPGVDQVMVATDDERILKAVNSFGGKAYLTPEHISTGSERVGWLAQEVDAEIVVNLQGDEPLIAAADVARAIEILQSQQQMHIATLVTPLKTEKEWQNPAVVKVLADKHMNALYFSRAPIPHPRDEVFMPLPLLFRHIGVYIFRKSFLLEFLKWPEGGFENREKLEQLRIMENGYTIKLVETAGASPGVDTPEDVAVMEAILKERGISSE